MTAAGAGGPAGEGRERGLGQGAQNAPALLRPPLVRFSAELKPQARIRGGVGGWNHSLLSTPGCVLAARKG